MRDAGDGDLVRQVLAGDPEAYAPLVARYRARLARFAVYQLGSVEDAEEVVQDAFVRAYRALPRCRPPEQFGAWLFGITVNRCRTRGGQRRRREERMVHDPVALEGASAPSGEERVALREAIRWAVALLPSEQREAFLLKHVEDLSYQDMVAVTGVGESALKMRVKRACERLRELLRKEVEHV